jgi:hypothetical protein
MSRVSKPILWGSSLPSFREKRMRVSLFECSGCLKWFITRGRSRYCSDACRQKAFRIRHRES